LGSNILTNNATINLQFNPSTVVYTIKNLNIKANISQNVPIVLSQIPGLLSVTNDNNIFTQNTSGKWILVPPPPPKPTSITVNTTNLNLSVGSTYQITATVQPLNAISTSVSWVSSNDSIISVSASGLITAKVKGSGIVTVYSNMDNKISATINVTVNDGSVIPDPGPTPKPDTSDGGNNFNLIIIFIILIILSVIGFVFYQNLQKNK
jgi:uncharacterized protein YjdB